jgi:hypothetical protein
METVVAQRFILAPNSLLRNRTRNDAEAGHGKEQHRCAKARDVRRGPLEDDPARVRGFVLTRLNNAHRGYGEERLAIGMVSTAACGSPSGTSYCKVHFNVKYYFHRINKGKPASPFKFGCMVSRGWGENEQLVISATALVHP